MRIIKVVTQLEAAKLSLLGTYAAREVAFSSDHCDKIVSSSIAVWELEVDGVFIGYAGVACETFLSETVFWCLFGAEHTRSTMKAYLAFSKLLHQHYPQAVTYVEAGWKKGERFAEFCGFVPTDQRLASHDKEYVKYKRKI